MKVLIINSGSSSIKFQLIDMENWTVLAKGLMERIGLDGSRLNYFRGDDKKVVNIPIKDHQEGIIFIIEYLSDSKEGVIKNKKEIYAVGHRVVHAGEKFSGTVMVTPEVMAALRECIPLAPLHNPPNIIGIEAAEKSMPGIPMAAVFDTAFHQSIPEKAYIYPIPYEYYEKYRIRRYGFHGTSHFFVAKQGAKQLKKKMEDLKIITCHLGNGSSMAAIKYGKSVDTTMGFTPLEGLMMGTRCGDLDPAIPLFLQRNKKLTYKEVDVILNKQSGLLGVSGSSSDMRDIQEKAAEGDEQASLALDIFTYRIKKYIGAYLAAMNGADLIIFTGGIGERGRGVRQLILEDMEFLGIKFDRKANEAVFGELGVISSGDSRIRVMVVPTNEELEIAEQTVEVVRKAQA
ncbi:MAG: acetate kinase [bacterium]|nr:acetate kinase [bacterium]